MNSLLIFLAWLIAAFCASYAVIGTYVLIREHIRRRNTGIHRLTEGDIQNLKAILGTDVPKAVVGKGWKGAIYTLFDDRGRSTDREFRDE